MKKATIHLAAFFSMLFWGISYIWSKIVFEYYTPLTTILFRLIISILVLYIFILLSKKKEKIHKHDYWLFIVGALFNPFLYFVGESYGLDKVSATISAFIIATIPVFTPFVGYFLLRERLSKLNIAGLILSFIGVFFIILRKNLELDAEPQGIALLFLAVLAAIIYSVFLKKLSARYKPTTIIFWQNLLGAIYFLPLFLYFDAASFLDVKPSVGAIFSLLMLGIFASSVAYVLYTFVVSQIGISKANLYTNLIPVFATIVAFFVLNEVATPLKIIGMLIIVSGVVLSQLDFTNYLKRKQ
ncbi:MAG TPA: DMT family transporter [Bacteroidales bacterium]